MVCNHVPLENKSKVESILSELNALEDRRLDLLEPLNDYEISLNPQEYSKYERENDVVGEQIEVLSLELLQLGYDRECNGGHSSWLNAVSGK